MTSLLQPGYTLNIGSQQWTQQAIRLQVKLETAPLIDVLSVRLPAEAPLSATIGDSVELTLKSGEKEKKVFTGKLDSVRRGFDDVRITALNAGAELSRYRPAVTYEQVSAGTVVRNLASSASVDTGNIEDGISLAFYVADPSRTALEHIARVCNWSGAIARVSADNQIESVVVNATQPDVALKYGREVISAWQWKLKPQTTSFVVVGESGAGDASSPDALRPSTDFFDGNSPDGPSPTSRWSSEPALRTKAAAGTAGAALQRAYDSSRETGRMDAFLQPDLKPGTILQIQELPNQLPGGPIWLYRVEHWLGLDGALTRAWFRKGGDAFNPQSLLGSLASAIGSAL